MLIVLVIVLVLVLGGGGGYYGYGTLDALYPGRIDLSLGRAPGSDIHTMRALRLDPQQSGDNFPALLQELRAYLGPERPGKMVKAVMYRLPCWDQVYTVHS